MSPIQLKRQRMISRFIEMKLKFNSVRSGFPLAPKTARRPRGREHEPSKRTILRIHMCSSARLHNRNWRTIAAAAVISSWLFYFVVAYCSPRSLSATRHLTPSRRGICLSCCLASFDNQVCTRCSQYRKVNSASQQRKRAKGDGEQGKRA